jgi:hypothetical protein
MELRFPLGPPVELEPYFATRRPHRRIQSIGIELEGGWLRTRNASVRPDTSVRFLQMGPPNVWCPRILKERDETGKRVYFKAEEFQAPTITGEIVSTPLAPDRFEPWFRMHYPHYVNHTCGLHVHMGISTLYAYQRLTVPLYPLCLVWYLHEWKRRLGKRITQRAHDNFSLRLIGGRPHCRLHHFPDWQAHKQTKDYHLPVEEGPPAHPHRYTVVNYCHRRLGTLECRVLPMFEQIDVAVEAVQEVMRITAAFLRATAQIGHTRAHPERLGITIPEASLEPMNLNTSVFL